MAPHHIHTVVVQIMVPCLLCPHSHLSSSPSHILEERETGEYYYIKLDLLCLLSSLWMNACIVFKLLQIFGGNGKWKNMVTIFIRILYQLWICFQLKCFLLVVNVGNDITMITLHQITIFYTRSSICSVGPVHTGTLMHIQSGLVVSELHMPFCNWIECSFGSVHIMEVD